MYEESFRFSHLSLLGSGIGTAGRDSILMVLSRIVVAYIWLKHLNG